MRASFRKNKDIVDYHLMMLPVVVFLAVFNIYPTLGSILAFKNFNPVKGIWASPWAGLDNFKMLFMIPDFAKITFNTLFISVVKIILNVSFALFFALLLNEVRTKWFKRSVQTIVYLPFFLSWVILAGIFKDIFSADGMVNGLLHSLGSKEPIMFFIDRVWFLVIIFLTDMWKGFGFNAIVFLAALTNINPSLYEAADVDGATRWQKMSRITLPSISPTIILVLVLSLQSILSAGFDQIFNFYNPLVYNVADIYDTYIYRMGIQSNQYEFATAVGLFRSTISLMFILFSQWLARKDGSLRVF